MEIQNWKDRLSALPLGDIHIYTEVSSTNEVAEELIQDGAKPFSLVLADSQIAGKGREGREWITLPGQALAFSWILYPEKGRVQPEILGRISGLGALAVAETIQEKLGLDAEIKWPNDVLVEGKKVAGILVEAHWQGCQLLDVILGIGINIGLDSIPPTANFDFPGSTLERIYGKEIDRLEFLYAVLESLLKWYRRLAEISLINAWNDRLAFKNEFVSLSSPKGFLAEGKLLGVDEDGSLILEISGGEKRKFHSGEIQLRLVDRI